MFVHPSTYFFHKHLASAHYVLGTTEFCKGVIFIFSKKMEVLKTTLVLALVLCLLHPLTHRHTHDVYMMYFGAPILLIFLSKDGIGRSFPC